MTKVIKKLLCLALLAVSISAQAQMTNYTKSFLKQRKAKETTVTPTTNQKIRRYAKTYTNAKQAEVIACFVTALNVPDNEIIARGGEISSVVGDQMIVVMPIDSIESLSKVEGIQKIDVSRPLRKKTDKARTLTQVEDVYNLSDAAKAAGLKTKYDGTGVVVGIIDDGIEFNHVTFQDAQGKSRVKAVYMPNATRANGGTKKIIDGTTLMGYEYTTEEQIKKLTTDDNKESHGTHTASTAAGSRFTTTGLSENTTYSGMAPGADIILCGLGADLTNAAVASAAQYIANYAKEHNQPCVISVSLGESMGPHDGTSSTTKFYDKIAEDYGAVILLAAGNEAGEKIFLSKEMEKDGDYLGTILGVGPYMDVDYTEAAALAGVDVWNSNSDSLSVSFVVFDGDLKPVYTSPRIYNGEVDATELAKYFSASALKSVDSSLKQGINVQGEINKENNRYNLYVDATLGGSDEGYELGMLVYGKNGNKITMWNDGYTTVFTGYADGDTPYTFQTGNGTCSICDDVTGKKTISVGAYASRQAVPVAYGKKTEFLDNGNFQAQDIATFSSYGTDFNGIAHPFVTAPGHAVVAAINRYNRDAWVASGGVSPAAYRHKLTNSTYDYWAFMSGTSMATPLAAGIVALYLQADKTLKVNDIRDVMRNSADKDEFTSSATTGYRFGVGKVNALKGIQYILSKANTDGIEEINQNENSRQGERIYNLQGQQLQQLQRGINIVNGKKIIKM